MRLDGIITLEIKIDGTWTDFTEGFMSSNIVRGVQSSYQGPFQQVESGILTVVSRNTNLDPYVNSDIRMNREVRIKASGWTIFTGRINTLNVDYKPKGKPQITTFTAVDMIGTMALHTLRDTFKSRLGSTMDTVGFVQELNSASVPSATSEIIGFVGTREGTSYTTTNAVLAPSATTALRMATGLSAGDLRFFYADRENVVKFVPSIDYRKNNSVKLQFDSEGGATNYRAVDLTDGFDLLKNKISFNTYGSLLPLYTNAYSESQWGPQLANIETYWPYVTTTNVTTDTLAANIFKQTANPTREISRITFDAEAAQDNVAAIDILDNVTVHHVIDNLEIERDYAVIGISHRITNTDWETTYHLRNLNTYDTVFPTPIVAISPSSGTILNTYTFTISNLNDIAHEEATYSWKDNNVEFSTLESPTKTYTLGQVGNHNIKCTVTDSYGFVKESAVVILPVYGAAPSSVSFTYTVNPSNTAFIEFAATATNATSYSWDFGDGQTGTGQNTTHLYSTSGNKTVTLTATNAYGSTQSIQTFYVTVPVTPTNEIGDSAIRYIKLGMPYFNSPSGYYFKRLKNLSALTSATLENRAATNLVIQGMPFATSGQPYGNHKWNNQDDDYPNNVPVSGACSSTLLRSGQAGLRPYNTIYGTANWGIIIDLQDTYFDIKNMSLVLEDTASLDAPDAINVWVPRYGNYISPLETDWRYIGYIDTNSGALVPLYPMPLNMP